MHALPFPESIMLALSGIMEALPTICGIDPLFKKDFAEKLDRRFQKYATLGNLKELIIDKSQLEAAICVRVSGSSLSFNPRGRPSDTQTFLFQLTCLEYASSAFKAWRKKAAQSPHGGKEDREISEEERRRHEEDRTSRAAEQAKIDSYIGGLMTEAFASLRLFPEDHVMVDEEDRRILANVDAAYHILADVAAAEKEESGTEVESSFVSVWIRLFQTYYSALIVATPSAAVTFEGAAGFASPARRESYVFGAGAGSPARGLDDSRVSYGDLDESRGAFDNLTISSNDAVSHDGKDRS